MAELAARKAGLGRTGCALVLVAFLGLGALATLRPWIGGPLLVAALVGGFFAVRRMAADERAEARARGATLRAIAAPEGDAWRRLFESTGLGTHIPSVSGLVRSALRLEEDPTGRSQLGGTPEVPPGFAWPVGDGVPCSFVARVDLAGLDEPLLPPSGSLLFFSDGMTDGAVFHATGPVTARDAPEGATTFARIPMKAVRYDDIPAATDEDLADVASDAWDEVREFLAGPGESPAHKLLGHPNQVQGAMDIECELVATGRSWADWERLDPDRRTALTATARRWRLLLQLDTDDAAGMMWGDVGRLYWWMTEEDLRAGRFEAAILLAQCH